MASYLDQSLQKLEFFEGAIPWMYLDTRGFVTVGVGLMLPDAPSAQKLAFTIADQPATPDEIAAEFARVHTLPMGRPALFYRKQDSPELPKDQIDSLLRTVLTGFESQLRDHLPGYDSFPDPAKLALLDMAYNLGPIGLLHGYPRLIAAVLARNWALAATCCYRNGPGRARNQWTQQMFQSAAPVSLKANASNPLSNLAFGAIGIGAASAEWLIHKLRKSPGTPPSND